MDLRCAIFDLDLTLASTASVLFPSWNAAMEAIGRAPMSDEEIIALFGPPEHVALREVTGDDYPEAFDAYLRHYHANLDSVTVYEGMPALLGALSERGISLGLVTGKGRATTEITLQGLDLRRHFAHIMTGDELKTNKPDPEGLLRIMRQVGASPAETVMIGDMMPDIQAARAAGVKSIAALWDCPWREQVLAEKPDHLCESVADLHRLLLG